MNLSAAVHRPPGRDDAADAGRRARGRDRVPAAAGVAAAAGRLPDDLGAGVAARREPGDDGGHGRHAARALARAHRRRHRDDVVAARSARRASRCSSTLSRDIDGAARDVQAAINAARNLLPTGLPSNPTYRKVNPGRRADHDPRAHVRHDDAGTDVRRRVDDPRAETVAGVRRRAR